MRRLLAACRSSISVGTGFFAIGCSPTGMVAANHRLTGSRREAGGRLAGGWREGLVGFFQSLPFRLNCAHALFPPLCSVSAAAAWNGRLARISSAHPAR